MTRSNLVCEAYTALLNFHRFLYAVYVNIVSASSAIVYRYEGMARRFGSYAPILF